MPAPSNNPDRSPRHVAAARLPRYVGVGELARVLKCTRQAVHLQILHGSCLLQPSCTYGGRYLFAKDSVERLATLFPKSRK
jgi:hypothetical protein